jgi:hypothetical protein
MRSIGVRTNLLIFVVGMSHNPWHHLVKNHQNSWDLEKKTNLSYL